MVLVCLSRERCHDNGGVMVSCESLPYIVSLFSWKKVMRKKDIETESTFQYKVNQFRSDTLDAGSSLLSCLLRLRWQDERFYYYYFC